MAIKINPAPLRMAQAVLIGLCAIMSVCILGTSAHTLAIFNKQQTSNPWWLPLWPQHFEVHGTKGLLGSAVTVFVLCSVFLVFALVPALAKNQKHTLRFLIALGTLLPSVLLTLVTVIYAHILNNNSPELDTIQTWTCKYKNSQPLTQDLPMPGDLGNGNFGAICKESRFALWGTLVVFLMLSMSVGLSFVTWLADKWAQRAERKEQEMEGAPQS
ncbi:hypothetical protein K505DRAFT_253390 [Melanomma pulvis-pyrius CBS 109.77]|uniref:MARVEL domain-containing protein n=1 Tax=Melanomma pulvis-pyrius CBS 109.77 TaxID=1314802 RepID=A0A6A6WZT0_9PLEO|nr:hypothetical protein K505DRAFT_253390 [Melanomma pulvis-pyrius CBS 109.77]